MTFILTVLLAPLVAGLGSDDFARREACQRLLERMPWFARPALERARRSADPEIAWRAERALARTKALELAFVVSPYRQAGWCDDRTAKYWAANDRWKDLRQMGLELGAFRAEESMPWGIPYQSMTLEDQVRAVINWGRNNHHKLGVLSAGTPWMTCAYPDGPPKPMPPPGTVVID